MAPTDPTPPSTARSTRSKKAPVAPDHRLHRSFTTLPDDAHLLVGSGHEVIMFDHAVTDAMVVQITHDGPGHYSFRFLVDDGQHHTDMFHGKGPHHGSYPLNFVSHGGFRYVEVKADGAWTVEFRPLKQSRSLMTTPGSQIAGEGCEVLQFATTDPTRIRVTSHDASTLILNAHATGSMNLLTRFDGFDGRLLVPAKVVAMSMVTRGHPHAPADWTITVG